jgi:hypothetical protein
MTAIQTTALQPGQQVRCTKMLTGYYYNAHGDDGTGCIDCVYLGTLGRVIAVPENDHGDTVIVDFGPCGHWTCWAHEIEVM